MNDFKITLNKRQQNFLAKLLPKGYFFQPYKVRKNINDYPYKEFDKKYKKTESIILSKKQSIMIDSLELSQKFYREKSEVPSIIKEQLTPLQMDLMWVVRKLRKHQSSYPFRSPVDPKALQVPDYFYVVLEPIDLKTIEQQIRADQYHHMSQFERDIYKMIMNSYKFNQKSTPTYNKTIQFEELFVSTIKEWEKLKDEEQKQERDEKELIKEEMIEENAVMCARNEEIQRKLQGFNLWNLRQNSLSAIPQNNVVTEPNTNSQNKQQKLLKILTEMAQQRPRVSKKRLRKIQQHLKQNPRSQSRQIDQPSVMVKQEQKEISIEEQQPIIQQEQPIGVFPPLQSQQRQVKKEQEQQINEELKDYLENQTVKEQNFSQGCNEFTTGNKIRNIEVQKEITALLKKLNQYPLTKQKKNKLFSKFTNLQQNMTQSDKKKLSEKISKLDQNDINYVIRIITRGKPDLLKQEEFEIDLDKADSKVLREIQNFIAIRDNASVTPTQNGTHPINAIIQSMQMIKTPKKVRKQEKKVLKKKISRKNSNNDQSFSINPPQIKKRRSQKPTKRQHRGDEQSSMNAQNNSINDEKESSSSYNPQVGHQGRVPTSQNIQKAEQTQKSIEIAQVQEKQKPVEEQKNKPQQKEQYPYRFDHTQIFVNNNPQSVHHTPFHYECKQIYDIDQFLVSSKHFPNDQQSSPEHGPFTSGRKKRQAVDPSEMMYDHNFQFGQSGIKDYPQVEIRQFSMDEQKKQNNDDDHFF